VARARVPAVASSTPDALWSSRAVRLLRPAAVSCEGVRRRVGRERVLDGVDLQVPVGARLLLVAEPDAAGSLLLRVLAGLSRADAGAFSMAGALHPGGSANGWGRRVAYLGPESGLYPWMSAAETLELSARLIGLEGEVAARRIADVVARWALGEGLNRPVRKNGLAYLQRTALAAALVGDPEVVLLDEPLRAVDPDERVRLLRLPGTRTTMLLASRYPASEEGAVNQVALLRAGRVALHAPISALEERALPLSHAGISRLAEMVAASRERAQRSGGAGESRASA
jgi:ABC-2 type transport system ATP-binding protein